MLRPSNSKIALFLRYAIILSIMLSIFSSQDAMSMVMDFDQFKWKNRLLFIFASERNDPFFRDLKGEISDRKNEVDDRDLVVFEILEFRAVHNEHDSDGSSNGWITPKTL